MEFNLTNEQKQSLVTKEPNNPNAPSPKVENNLLNRGLTWFSGFMDFYQPLKMGARL